MVAKGYSRTQCGVVGLLSYTASMKTMSSHKITISKRIDNILRDYSSYQYTTTDATTTSSSKSCMRTESSPKASKKIVSFDSIKIREHPRILGDNPSVKRGPALSLGWYNKGRETKLSVEEYENLRSPDRKKCLAVSACDRMRTLKEEAGVSYKQMLIARKEAAKIRRSRKQNNAFLDYDEAIIVFESCTSYICKSVTRIHLGMGSAEAYEASRTSQQVKCKIKCVARLGARRVVSVSSQATRSQNNVTRLGGAGCLLQLYNIY